MLSGGVLLAAALSAQSFGPYPPPEEIKKIPLEALALPLRMPQTAEDQEAENRRKIREMMSPGPDFYLEGLPSAARSGRAWLETMTLPDDEPESFTTTYGYRKIRSLENRAEARERERERQPRRRNDRLDEAEDLSGSAGFAVADALVTGIDERYPNRVTGALRLALEGVEVILREIPLELREDARDIAVDLRDGVLPHYDRDRPYQEDSSEERRERERTEIRRVGASLRGLKPQLNLKLRPKAKLNGAKPEEVSVSAGGSLKLHPTPKWTMKFEGGYDTQDRGWEFFIAPLDLKF